MTDYGAGFDAICGLDKETTYGTPVAVGALDKFNILSESLGMDADPDHMDELCGKAYMELSHVATWTAGGSLDVILRYVGKPLCLLAAALGSQTTPGLNDSLYSSEMVMTDTLQGNHFTIVIDKQRRIHELISCKVQGFNLNIAKGQRAELSFDLVPYKLDLASTTNTQTQVDALTSADGDSDDICQWKDFKLYALPWDSVSDLESEDPIAFSDASISWNNNMRVDHSSGGAGYIDEPQRDGFAEGSLSISLPYYTDDSDELVGNGWDKDVLTGEFYKIKILAYNADEDRAICFLFPKAKLMAAPRFVDSAGLIAAPLDFELFGIGTAQAEFGITDTVALTSTKNHALGSDLLEPIRVLLLNNASAACI